MMKSIYNNIKGVFGAICLISLLFLGYSCSQGTDEELISKKLDVQRMSIHPYGCVFYIDDELDNKPEEMFFLVNRALKSWKTSYLVGFEEEIEGYKYKGDMEVYYQDKDNNTDFVAGYYHAMCFTHDAVAFDYSDISGFQWGSVGITQIGLKYNVDDSNLIVKPARIFSCFLDNYYVDEGLDGEYFKLDPECLTQRYVWEFYIKKTDTIARVDAVEAEIDGVPCSVELRSASCDASKVAKVKAFGDMLNGIDDFDPGRDTIRISFDALPIVAPSHLSKIGLVENEVGNLNVRLAITGKHWYKDKDGKWQVKFESKDWVVRHRMYELDSIPVYDLQSDNIHLVKKSDAPKVWEYKIEDDILINKDEVNSRRYGKWQVVK